MSTVTLGLVGDTMLGRNVADRLHADPDAVLVDPAVREAASGADLLLANLECCLSDRGEPWPDPGKAFFFRGPPHATRVLTELGVDAVTLANNHALDFGEAALHDTLEHLDAAGIAVAGAGPDVDRARDPLVVDVDGLRVGVLAATDHPTDFAAGPDRAGVAHVDLWNRRIGWLEQAVRALAERTDLVVVTPHWGPNMTSVPVPHVRWAAPRLVAAGATVVAGHSAHVFHGVEWDAGACVLYDLGDFLDDYAVDPSLRNDLGVLWLVTLEDGLPTRIDAVPLFLDNCFTRLAAGADRRWIERRLARACERFGSVVEAGDDRVTIRPGESG